MSSSQETNISYIPGNAIAIIEEEDSHGGTIKNIVGTDISKDTVVPGTLLEGYTAHTKEGQAIVGVLKSGNYGGCVCFNISFEEAEYNLSVDFDDDCSCMCVDFGELMPISDFDYYDGEYIVTPKTVEQSLATHQKAMRDDVTVLEIPYTESDNLAGGRTVTIAFV